jgi:hypothetical protein
MGALIAKRVENKFMNFEIFWKIIENAKNDANT